MSPVPHDPASPPEGPVWARALMRLVIATYPPSFRRRHGAEMMDWFLGRLSRQDRPGPYVRRAVVDGLGQSLALWRERFPISALSGRVLPGAFRSLRRRPAWTALVVLGLALPAGVNSVVLSLVQAGAMADLPYPDTDRLGLLTASKLDEGLRGGGITGPELDFLDRTLTTAASVGGIWPRTATLGHDDGPVHVSLGFVTGGFFPTLGVQPELGRTIASGDDVAGAEAVVLLSHATFVGRFGGDPTVVGRPITLNGESRTVVGVLPEDFALFFPDGAGVPRDLDVFIPWAGGYAEMDPQWRLFRGVVRLAPDRTWGPLGAELDAVSDEVPLSGATVADLDAEPARAAFVEVFRSRVGLAAMGSFLLLLVAASNTAGLLIARATERAPTARVLSALGATRSQIASQAIAEVVLLFATATLVGWVLATVGLDLFLAVGPAGMPLIEEPSISPGVVFATFAVMGALAAVVTLAPGLRNASRSSVSGARAFSAAGLQRRSGVVVAQVALATVLTVGTALMIRTVDAMGRVPLGIQPENATTLRFSISGPEFSYTEPEAIAGFYEDFMRAIRDHGSVHDAAVIEQLPLRAVPGDVLPYRSDDDPRDLSESTTGAIVRPVSAEAFSALGATFVDGQTFDSDHGLDGTPAVVIDRTLAEAAWPDGPALGRRLEVDLFVYNQIQPTWVTVIGVIEPIKMTGLTAPDAPQLWVHHQQSPRRTMSLVVRHSLTDGELLAHLRATNLTVAPDRAFFDVEPLGALVERGMEVPRFLGRLLSAYGVLALGLAVFGLYATLTYHVSGTRRELGIRAAIGASPRMLIEGVARRGLLVVTTGVVLGTAIAWLGAGVAEGLIFGFDARDLRTFVAAILVTGGASLIALLHPALRAARTAPRDALTTP